LRKTGSEARKIKSNLPVAGWAAQPQPFFHAKVWGSYYFRAIRRILISCVNIVKNQTNIISGFAKVER